MNKLESYFAEIIMFNTFNRILLFSPELSFEITSRMWKFYRDKVQLLVK